MELFLALLTMVAALVLGAMIPGPSFLLVARMALSESRRAGVAVALGMGVGGMLLALMAVLGLLALLAAVPVLYLVLKVCGGVYLLYLAFRIWQDASLPFQADDARIHADGKGWRAFVLGFTTQVSNPKTAVAYASIFASLLPKDTPISVLAVLPIVLFVIEAGWYCLVAYVLSSPVPRERYLQCKTWIDRLAASLMGLLGAKLLLDAIRQN